MTPSAAFAPAPALALAAALSACEGGGGGTGDDASSLGPGDGTATGSTTGASTTEAPATTNIDDADGTGTSAGMDGPEGSTTDATTGTPPIECMPVPNCLAPLPEAGPLLEWEHFESSLVTASGSERHRGRDMFYNPGDAHWALGKFAYGSTD